MMTDREVVLKFHNIKPYATWRLCEAAWAKYWELVSTEMKKSTLVGDTPEMARIWNKCRLTGAYLRLRDS